MTTLIDTALALGRWIELSILVKATLIVALGLIAARLARRAQASVRHLLLAVTFAALAALPLVVATAPGVTIRVPVARAAETLPAEAPAPPATSAQPPARSAQPIPPSAKPLAPSAEPVLLTVARWIWLAGTAALCLSLAMAFRRVQRIRRDGLPRPDLRQLAQSLADRADVRRRVDVLEHEQVLAPLTCGVWRPAIVLPSIARDWDEADLTRALVHELEHVRRGDWAVQVAARVVCACYWFHPLVWTAFRHLCLDAERACDDAVVRDAERTDYADQLVTLASRLSAAHAPAMLGMANRSDLSVRVAALLDDRQRRGPAGVLAAMAALILAAAAVTTIAPLRAIASYEPAAIGPAEAGAAGDQRVRSGGRARIRGIDRALFEAAVDGDLREVDQLIQAGANVNAAIDGDGSPLIGAALSDRIAVVERLLDRGADPNMPVLGDGSPLIAAARSGSLRVVALLLDRGALIDQMVPGDENALIQASGEGHLEVVRFLVGRGANVNARVWVERGMERQGEWRSPLSMARQGRHEAVVTFLMSVGAYE